jgi:ribosomal protein S18 acetylase RimI-like enzyme
MLTNQQLNEIEELQKECEAEDQIQLKLNWSMLRNPSDEEMGHLFHYEVGRLVGFLGVYRFGNKAELCGMVKPSYRRKGIFSKLFSKVNTLIETQKFTEVLLNAPSNSHTAKGFLKNISCDYSISEYQMQWEETKLVGDGTVTLRPSTEKDFEDEVQLDVQCFGLNEDDARKYRSEGRRADEQEYFMIEKDNKTVGKIRVSHSNGKAWIYGFAIFPEYQGKGIGRNVLANVIIKENQGGYPIFLEVEAKNAHALRLYESCGFRAYHSQDYYEYKR